MGRRSDAVAEGLQIAGAAARLTVKNEILVDTIAHGADFDADDVAAAAREVLRHLAKEQEDAARTVDRQRKRASRRSSDPMDTHDYRDRDVRNLKRRREQYLGVAAGLRDWADNPEQVRDLVETSRLAAWSDVEGNLDRRLRVEAMRPEADPEYDLLREARMDAVALIDLQRLASRQRKLRRLP